MTSRTKRQKVSAVGSSITAAQDLVAEMQQDDFAVLDGFEPREGHIYVRTRAISARINQNFDGFPSDELRKAYKTFLGKPVFVNHANSDTKRARGRVVAAAYLERGDDKYIDTFMEVNARKYPRLAHELQTGGLDAVSMGCEAQRTVCSVCNNEASGLHDMCEHVLFMKGQTIQRELPDGRREAVLVYESCYDLGFFELSFVFDPADETALASKVFVASRRTPNRIYCDLPGCRRWTNIGGENSQQWVQRNGEQRTYDYCCTGHREQYEKAYPDWLRSAAIRNPHKVRAFGEVEAPPPVDTLRDETDDGDDYHRYVEPPKELGDPDLDRAQELDRREDVPGATDTLPEETNMTPPPNEAPVREQIPASRQVSASLVWAPTGDGYEAWSDDSRFSAIVRDETEYGTVVSPDGAPGPETNWGQTGGGWAWEVWNEDTDQIVADGVESHREYAQEAAENAIEQQGVTANRKDTNMGKPSLADRGREASRGRLRHADQSRNDQGEWEDTFITQTPPPEPVETAEGEEITNTEDNLVATVRAGRAAEARLRRLRARRKEAEEKTPTVVNPPLSGADSDELKGDNFESADPNDGVQETQPKDASRKVARIRRAFRAWIVANRGTTITAAANRAQLLRWAADFARENGLDVKAMYPVVRVEAEAMVKKATDYKPGDAVQVDGGATGVIVTKGYDGTNFNYLVEIDQGDRDYYTEDRITPMGKRTTANEDEGVSADKKADPEAVEEFIDNPGDADKKESKRREGRKTKTADEKLDVAAPDGRVDVERPTQDTTDDEAQASQFDRGDFGDNAGDDIADPDLSTDHIYPPGEGKRSHRAVKRAGGIQAMRLAEAFVAAGLDEKNKGRYTLAAEFEQMSAGLVADRIQLLEAVIRANGLGQRQERRTAGVRGGGVRSAVPQNFTARQQAASAQHTAASEIGNPDSDIFF